MPSNRLRERLHQNLPTLGTRIESTWPLIVEAVGSTGQFDYIEFVAEYAPFSQADLENIARAAELHDLSPVIKVDFQNRAYVAQRAMASGFQALNMTDHKTAAEVRETLHAIRPDTPQDGGRFGYPNRRWIGFTPHAPQMEYAQMVRDTVLILMIEKAEAMQNIEEICRVPGVDMVQFGPSDYAMSRGWNAGEHGDELRAIERDMIEVAQKHGVAPRAEIQSAKDARYYADLGVRHFCLGDELANNLRYWNGQGRELRGMLESSF